MTEQSPKEPHRIVLAQTLDDDWALARGLSDLSPIVEALVERLNLEEEHELVSEALTAAWLRGVKAAVVELTAQLTEQGVSSHISLEIDDSFELDEE